MFFLNAALWFGYGVYIYYDMAVLNNNRSSADIVTIFVFVNAVAMLVSGIQFGKLEKSGHIILRLLSSLQTPC